MSNLALNLIRSAQRRPEHRALVLDGKSFSYRELDEASARVAGMLRERGVEPGERVGIMLPNVIEFAIAYYGALRAGCVVVPMNVLLKEREVAFYVGDSGARLVFAWHECAAVAAHAGAECVVVAPGALAQGLEPLRAVTERAGDDTAVILYTSGTTGKPKGAELTHANLGRNVDVVLDLFSIGADDVVLGALPLFHSFGQTCGLNAVIAAGATLALVARFAPGVVLELVQRERVTVFEGVPTMYSALLNHPDRSTYDVATLRVCASGGAALPLEVLRGFEAAFGCVISEGYGLSETSPIATFNDPRGRRKPGSIGRPVAGVELKLIDTVDGAGEIAIRGHNVMKGYWKRPEATADAIDADGWFRTGDIARVDDDGFYFIVDRKKDLIIRGGYNVYPREVEEVVYEHPAVREAAVIGIPHDELGEEVAAVVALRAGAELETADLREYVKERVAAYKYPREVWFVDELPKGPTGKILKRAIERPALR